MQELPKSSGISSHQKPGIAHVYHLSDSGMYRQIRMFRRHWWTPLLEYGIALVIAIGIGVVASILGVGEDSSWSLHLPSFSVSTRRPQ